MPHRTTQKSTYEQPAVRERGTACETFIVVSWEEVGKERYTSQSSLGFGSFNKFCGLQAIVAIPSSLIRGPEVVRVGNSVPELLQEIVGGLGSGLVGLHIEKVLSKANCLLSLGISSSLEGLSLPSQQVPRRQSTKRENIVNTHKYSTLRLQSKNSHRQ